LEEEGKATLEMAKEENERAKEGEEKTTSVTTV